MADLNRQQLAYRRAQSEGIARANGSADPAKVLATIRRHQQAGRDKESRSALLPHSCDFCQVFIIDTSGPESRLNEDWIGPKLLKFKHVNLTHVKTGARNDCKLCHTILAQLDRNKSSFEDDSDQDLTCFTQIAQGQGGEFDAESMTGIGVWNSNRMWTKWANKDYLDNRHYSCVAGAQDPASNFVTTRPIVIDPSSEDSFNLIRSWRAECSHGHQVCQMFQTLFRPLRLVEISGHTGTIEVRIAEAIAGPIVEYTTLSYCWGGPQPAQTTVANVPERKLSVNFADLPATIRDAITITHRLGISYIWVDSLCIIQDDAIDKAIQIASMPQIYQNSSLTISTTRSMYADEGFLGLRKPTDFPEQVFELPYLLPSTGQLGHITIFPQSPEVTDDNLTSRGWTLQEHALSPRILDFAGGQTRWLCRQWYSDGWQKHEGLRTEWFIREKVQAMVLNKIREIQGVAFTFPEGCRFWEELVTKYTQRSLSVSSDRPLAIAGLAEICCGNLGWKEQYQAGLWRSMFPWALMWSMADRECGRLSRPTEHQGPSWSWTSVNGAIHYGLCEKLSNGQITLKTIDCSTELKYEEAPFGGVKSGALIVEGKALRAKWLRSDMAVPATERNLDHDRLLLEEARDGLDKVVALKFRPDAEEADWADSAKEHVSVILLEIGYEPEEHRDYHGALGFVLRELEDGFYSRLGVFETSRGPDARPEATKRSEDEAQRLWEESQDIFRDCEREVLIIV